MNDGKIRNQIENTVVHRVAQIKDPNFQNKEQIPFEIDIQIWNCAESKIENQVVIQVGNQIRLQLENTEYKL